MMASASGAFAEKLTLERMFTAPDLSGASLRQSALSPDGRLVTYLKGKDTDKDRMDLWAYDIQRHEHRQLVDSARLVPQERALSPEEEQRRERARISSLSGIVDYELSPDARHILVPLGGDLYVYDLQAPAGANPVRRLTNTNAYETDAHFSPRGTYVSFIRSQNLYVHELSSGREWAITHDGGGLLSYGTAEFIAQEEMDRTTGYWWSPDEKSLAFTRVDESPVDAVQRFEIYANTVQVVQQRYPAAGRRNAHVQLLVASLGGQPPVMVDLGKDADIYLARVNWFPDGHQLAVQRESRDQKTLTLLAVQAATGSSRVLLTEHSDTWIDLHDELTFLAHSPRFIWASSASGHRHLYLYDLEGRLLGALTHGAWEVIAEGAGRAIRGIDEKQGLVYFMGSLDSPLERHLYSVSLTHPGGAPKRITQGSGWHAVSMSRDTQVFLDTFSTPESPPSLTLRTSTGQTLAELVPNTLKAGHPYFPYVTEQVPIELGSLRASDGQTLYYQMLRPKERVPGRRYPVIVDVYGGPGVQRVRRAWGGYPRSNEGFFRQYLAQHGYIVFTLDNRGTPGRGTAFRDAIYHHLGHVEVEDQKTGVSFLRSLPYVDPARIGVFGWSYGGYMALQCILQAPDSFTAAVAGAPVTDWRLYDTHYTERFMGTPAENEQGYKDSSVLTRAATLKRPLLVLHGMADDNVLFTHSTALFKILQDHNKPFEQMTYPGHKHGLLRHPDAGLHAYTTIVSFFDRVFAVSP